MITAGTITDEQIRELRLSSTINFYRDLANAALDRNGGPVKNGRLARRYTQAEARARCAEILNARGSK